MKTELAEEEKILKQGMANLQRGSVPFGGKLYLTNRRLVFEPHVANPRCDTAVIPIEEVSTVEKCWTKVLKFIPLTPNTVIVRTSAGEEYRFVLFGREVWASAIGDARGL
jgi:hypothetical protein